MRGYAKANRNGVLVPADPLPSAVALFDQYEGSPDNPGSFLYRYTSAFAHGKQWGAVQGVELTRPGGAKGHLVGRVTANDEHISQLCLLATDAATRAATSYLNHHAPSDQGTGSVVGR